VAPRYRLVFFARIPFLVDTLTKLLGAEPDVDLVVVPTFEELKVALPGADGLILVDIPLEMSPAMRALLREPTTTLRWIHVISAGREGIDASDVPPAIVVTSAAGAHSPVLGETIMAYILAFVRRIPEFARATAEHKWDRSVVPSMTSVEGQTLAIVGLGHVGRELAKRARAFGMKIVAATRTPKDEPLVDEVHPLAKLHDVLARADFVALTIAQSAETTHLIGAAEFAVCKPTAYFVNMARGGIVDQVALVEALRAGTIAGIGTDVTDPEPLPPDDPLWAAPNVVISPHCAGSTSPFSQQRLSGRVMDNLDRLRKGTLVPT
jgi:phosphoglycerate dehydrogenase-like enzyme